MIKLSACLYPFLFLFVTASAVVASPLEKMATVDVNRVMNELGEAQSLKKRLDAKSAAARTKIEKEKESLQKLEDSIKAKGLGQDSKEFEDLRTRARDFERMVKDTEEDLRREFLKDNQQLTQKVLAAVKKYAEGNDIQLVLDKSNGGRGPVLFGDPGADITSDLLEELNN